MVSKLIANSHFILNVKNSDICVGAFTNYVHIGVVEKLTFVENTVTVPLRRFKSFKKYLSEIICYFTVDSNLDVEHGGECFKHYNWKGEFVNGQKTLCFYKNEQIYFNLNISGFFNLLMCLSKALPFTFLFTNIDICFCETITQSEDFYFEIARNESKLRQLIDDICKRQSNEANFSTKSSLRHIFSYYHDEFQSIIWLNEYRCAATSC